MNIFGIDAGSNAVIIEANGSEDIEVILAGIYEGIFMNISSIDNLKDKLASELAKQIKSWFNMRRSMRMGPIHPKCYQLIDQFC